MKRWVLGAAVLVAALLPAGCGKSPPPFTEVEGVVTVNGKPLPQATVTFAPTATGFGAEVLSTAVTDDNGRFKLACGNKSGACVGEHKVTVSEAPLPEKLRGMSGEAQREASRYLAALKNRPIPQQYSNYAQTPLTITVTQDKKEYPISLQR